MRWRDTGPALAALAADVWLPCVGLFAVAGIWWAVHAAAYAWSVAFRPLVDCWACGGKGAPRSGGLPGWLWPWGEGVCWRCAGRKQLVRWGVRVLTPGYRDRLITRYRPATRASRRPRWRLP